jgi:hypothetical protein
LGEADSEWQQSLWCAGRDGVPHTIVAHERAGYAK